MKKLSNSRGFTRMTSWCASAPTRGSVPVSAGSDYEANYECDPVAVDPPYYAYPQIYLEQHIPSYYNDEDYFSAPYTDDNARKAAVMPKILSQAVALPSAAVMWSYHRSGNICGLPKNDLTAHGTTFRGAEYDPRNISAEILRLIGNPPPEAFLISMLAYGAGIATLYHINRRDRYQDAALAVGITAAFGVGSLLGEDARSIFLRILPFTVLAILALSGLAHQLGRWIFWQLKANMERENPLPGKLDILDC
ncbi:hypothetical protein CPLU01_07179 [Colletotrichum plurivorum]|uniref:Uncharacterized protein n=1 Tax=Colletotrichum plurivorum TaxID=2175906 RepID=A0A8H6KFW1_9PEZI|nr:hypothetical protein CPLU01_07179 [Colletotrichum plurivorum]